jgi:3-phenylpropionate/cinnamic acid dioxygenase small subunit
VLHREARLLDAGHYSTWLDLWADDGIWWAPVDVDVPQSSQQSLALDDVRRLRERVAWLEDPSAWSQHPPTRCVRAVSNVEGWAAESGAIVASSTLSIAALRRTTIGVAARQVHELVPGPGGLRIRRKVLLLVDADRAHSNPGFLL